MQEFKVLLAHSSQKHRQALSKLLDCSGDSPAALAEGFRKHNLTLFGRTPDHSPSYPEIVRKLAGKLKIQRASTMAAKEAEIAVAEKVFKTGWRKLTLEQKQLIEQTLHRTANTFDKTGTIAQAGSVFGALTVAQLSGFGIYLMSSTALGFISGAVSLTLPFAVYSTVSSAIALVIGPAGWLGAGLLTIWKLTRPSYKRLISAVVFLAMLRAEREYRLFRPVKPPTFASLDA